MCATFFCESARHAYYMYKTIEEVFELSLSALELQQYCTSFGKEGGGARKATLHDQSWFCRYSSG